MADLKPCPFCGARQICMDRRITDGLFSVVCDRCGGRSKNSTTKDLAVALWNTRCGYPPPPGDWGAPRRVEIIAKVGADSWEDLRRHLDWLSTEIARNGILSPQSISGGCHVDHIIVASEDGSITHDLWASEMERYLERLKEVSMAQGHGG